ncbi:MAG: hypothetical protein KDC87_14710 [Planctomycetes bacterium]|nr:hypothetical protein [Planctomycetota bacterium]MCB9872449.1 hypothetical protein [Planctomycetota bacterium]
MKNLDLEKLIIILSLVLIPVAGGWVYYLRDKIAVADTALAAARDPRGIVKELLELQGLIDQTKEELEKQGGDATEATTYFRGRLAGSMTPGSALPIKVADILVEQRQPIKNDRGGYADLAVSLRFGKGGRMELPRSFVNAFIVNSESQSPIWKLRSLRISNAEMSGGVARKSPSLEMKDDWIVREMVFARRRPLAKSEKKK